MSAFKTSNSVMHRANSSPNVPHKFSSNQESCSFKSECWPRPLLQGASIRKRYWVKILAQKSCPNNDSCKQKYFYISSYLQNNSWGNSLLCEFPRLLSEKYSKNFSSIRSPKFGVKNREETPEIKFRNEYVQNSSMHSRGIVRLWDSRPLSQGSRKIKTNQIEFRNRTCEQENSMLPNC